MVARTIFWALGTSWGEMSSKMAQTVRGAGAARFAELTPKTAPSRASRATSSLLALLALGPSLGVRQSSTACAFEPTHPHLWHYGHPFKGSTRNTIPGTSATYPRQIRAGGLQQKPRGLDETGAWIVESPFQTILPLTGHRRLHVDPYANQEYWHLGRWRPDCDSNLIARPYRTLRRTIYAFQASSVSMREWRHDE